MDSCIGSFSSPAKSTARPQNYQTSWHLLHESLKHDCVRECRVPLKRRGRARSQGCLLLPHTHPDGYYHFSGHDIKLTSLGVI